MERPEEHLRPPRLEAVHEADMVAAVMLLPEVQDVGGRAVPEVVLAPADGLDDDIEVLLVGRLDELARRVAPLVAERRECEPEPLGDEVRADRERRALQAHERHGVLAAPSDEEPGDPGHALRQARLVAERRDAAQQALLGVQPEPADVRQVVSADGGVERPRESRDVLGKALGELRFLHVASVVGSRTANQRTPP